LYAAGEVASTGVHGANRLASNSLLEAIVFAKSAAEASVDQPRHAQFTALPSTTPRCIPEAESIRIRRTLQHLMTEKAGIVRTTTGLREARRTILKLMKDYDSQPAAPFSQHPLETYNILLAARCVVHDALARKVNAGLHYNSDLPTSEAPSSSSEHASAANSPQR
jgi:L-aspartate oxidase